MIRRFFIGFLLLGVLMIIVKHWFIFLVLAVCLTAFIWHCYRDYHANKVVEPYICPEYKHLWYIPIEDDADDHYFLCSVCGARKKTLS